MTPSPLILRNCYTSQDGVVVKRSPLISDVPGSISWHPHVSWVGWFSFWLRGFFRLAGFFFPPFQTDLISNWLEPCFARSHVYGRYSCVRRHSYALISIPLGWLHHCCTLRWQWTITIIFRPVECYAEFKPEIAGSSPYNFPWFGDCQNVHKS